MAISIQYWANYTAEEPKLMRKSENAVISNHVLKFLFDQETKMIHAVVQASMRNTSYKVTVRPRTQTSIKKAKKQWKNCFPLHAKITALKWILEPEPCEPGPPVPVIEDLLTSPEYVHSDAPMVWLRHALSLSEEAIKRTAFATIGQRNNPMWSIVRKYGITASNFGTVLSSKQRRMTLSLKKQLMSAYNLESIKAVVWGITHEDDALRKYEKDFDAAVEQSGIWLHESGVLGASPDGLVVRPPTCSQSFYKNMTN
ncbi:uncharacterized protein LOC133200518 [Saccostrea echinata]|uniref:uncharacterized protein LOC133200518 n=1 Tax=Saccostrea echinata TaxID=191078 RepID=UPI002A838292|nr:uncharacterized protein LOC133200518 [Saccostrea echinata]